MHQKCDDSWTILSLSHNPVSSTENINQSKRKTNQNGLIWQFIFQLITFTDLFKLAPDSQFNSKSLEAHRESEEIPPSLPNGACKQLLKSWTISVIKITFLSITQTIHHNLILNFLGKLEITYQPLDWT